MFSNIKIQWSHYLVDKMHTQLHTGQSHVKIINCHHLNLEYIGHNYEECRYGLSHNWYLIAIIVVVVHTAVTEGCIFESSPDTFA